MLRHPTHHWWAVAPLFLLGGCDAGSAVSDRTTEIAVSQGAIHTLPTPDVVARVVDLQPAQDGRIWVLNSVDPYFVVLSPDGQVEREFGSRGGGPQEFGAPWALVPGSGRSDVWTYDVRRSALIRISGDELRELTLSPDSFPASSLISFKGAGINQAPPWVERGNNGFLMARSRSPLRETALQAWSADIHLLREEGPGSGPSIYSPIADLIGDPASKYGAATTTPRGSGAATPHVRAERGLGEHLRRCIPRVLRHALHVRRDALDTAVRRYGGATGSGFRMDPDFSGRLEGTGHASRRLPDVPD